MFSANFEAAKYEVSKISKLLIFLFSSGRVVMKSATQR
ncbi:hypothetical protein C7428_3520 [Pantoea ananatis]|nr:hypothetical protein C7428_3520 [Pantoea ananatis]